METLDQVSSGRRERSAERAQAQRLADDHRCCVEAVTRIEALLEAGRRVGRWQSALTEELAALEASLSRHFESEEESSFYRDLATEAPRYASRLTTLRAEHDAMRGELRSVLSAAPPGQVEQALVEAALQRVARLVEVLRAHEASENELLTAAYWDDLGGRG